MRRTVATNSEMEMHRFIQGLTQFLTSWQATTFLVGEYSEEEMRGDPLFTMADGLIWLSQVPQRNSVARKLQIMKLRGQGSVPGLHTIRISEHGLQAFSRMMGFMDKIPRTGERRRLSIGVPELDAMLGGGILEGDSCLVAGPSGTGKSALATQFIAAGLRDKEPAIIASFEERPQGYADRAAARPLREREEWRIDRREGEDLVVRSGQQSGCDRQPRDHAGRADDPVGIGAPAVQRLEMCDECRGEAGRVGRVAKHAMIHAGVQRIEHHVGRAEIHVGHPQWQNIPAGPAVPLLGAGAAAVGAVGKRVVRG
jgi:KaiC/GvpD/RAD55 family RecA-like ATPase